MAAAADVAASLPPHTQPQVSDVFASRLDTVTLTSFGPFLDVTLNPSQAVADHVHALLGEALSSAVGFDEASQLKHDKGLEVSITRVGRYISEKRAELLGKLGGEGSNEKINFFIHFGVHNGSRAIKVELTGVNCVGWRGTDFEGFTCPDPRPITPLTAPGAAVLAEGSREFYSADICGAWDPFVTLEKESTDSNAAAIAANGTDLANFGCIHVDNLPMEAVAALVTAANVEVLGDAGAADANAVKLIVSHSAGRYLCNFMLYSSLAMTSEVNAKAAKEGGSRNISLFVHVVAIEDMPAEEQARLITSFLLRWMLLGCAETK